MDIHDNNVPSTNTTDSPSFSNVNLSYLFQFLFFIPFHILSIPCYLFIITYIVLKKTQRQALHNHPLIVFLILSSCIVIFDYSWALDSIRHDGRVWLSSGIFCEVWWFLDFACFNAGTVILSWASFERHILIFHSGLVQTQRKRILVHYLPLIIISLYLFIFYVYAIFFPPCENQYDFTLPICGAYPCYITIPHLALLNTFFHGIIPTFLIAFFNIALLIRVIWQKQHHHQDWKKCRRMAFQLLSISILFLSMNFPMMLIAFVQNIAYPDWAIEAQEYLFFFSGLIQYLLPFICLMSLPNIWTEMKLFCRRGRRQVIPIQSIRPIQRI